MGEVFAGRYELMDPIGAGGMGTVWRVLDQRTGNVVAAKVLRHSHAAALLRFVREQAVRVHHPNILVPLGWAGEDDRVLFTMPLVAGGSVADLVGDFGPLPPRFAAEIARQLIGALAAVHAAGLVHRDVTPANILLDATGPDRPHAYLSDFGLAYDSSGPRLTEAGMVTGTPGYLAPELVSFGEPRPASDLYSAGVVIAHMLTAERVGDAPPAVDLTTPESLRSLVRDLTAADPAARPAPAEALRRLGAPELAWQDGAAGEIDVFDHLAPWDGAPAAPKTPAAPEPPTRPEPPARRPGRLRDVLVYAACGLAVLAGALVMLLG